MKIPDREDAINAVDILVRYIEQCGKDLREGLEKTPERVIKSYEEIFRGYSQDAGEILDSTFNAEGYDGIVLLGTWNSIAPASIIYNHSQVGDISLTSL